MKELILALLLSFSLFSCAGLNGSTAEDRSKLDNYKEFMSKIPNNEFNRFEYHRNGFYSNANITALGAKKVDGILSIDSVSFDAKYGPESISVNLEGYKRTFEPEGVRNE